MAFVNLPPNLQDMFRALADRISKLETGPSTAMTTAESAQSVATDAEIQAINAGVQANNAAAQATIAQSQATIASTQATTAIATANGKNKVTYSTSGPGSTANSVGDIWYQYGTSGTYLNKVIAQWSGAGGTSWTSVTVSGLVIANIDAGAITTGTLSAIQISAGSGATSFNVSSTGVMSAQGVYVKGAIVADSGTFTGSIRANDGYFGTGSGGTLTNGWAIGAAGLTGVGSGTISGGAISGATITANSGTIGGWSLSATRLYSGASELNASNGNAVLSAVTVSSLSSSGTISTNTNQNINSGGALTCIGSATFGQSAGLFEYLSSSGNIRVSATYSQTASARAMYVTTSGLYGTLSSTERRKENIVPYAIDMDKLLQLDVKKFNFKPEYDDDQLPQYGFIAEDADMLGLYELTGYDENGLPDYFAYEKLPIFLLQVIQNQEARIKALEGN
jgi:hypothetical protein